MRGGVLILGLIALGILGLATLEDAPHSPPSTALTACS